MAFANRSNYVHTILINKDDKEIADLFIKQITIRQLPYHL